MSINPLKALKDNYIWAVVNEQEHTLICVDPGEAAPVLGYAKTHHLKLTGVLITHHHSDHMAGIPELLEVFPSAAVYGPEDDRIPGLTFIVRNEDILDLGGHAFRVLSIPGHTVSHVAYQEPVRGWLFCGDTLFSAGCGRVFDGSLKTLYQSLQLLKTLPDNTEIYCGHEYTRQNLAFAAEIEPENQTIASYRHYLESHPDLCSLPSTLGLEKQINPFLRVKEPDGLDEFKRLRALKDEYRVAP